MSVRAVDLVRAAVGVRALLVPPALAFGRRPAAAEAALLRVLGARQVLQALVTARTGYRALGTGVDLLHAATMLPLLVAPARYGRAAGRQLVTAALLAGLELVAQRRS